jgi:hypothetical protein
MIGLAPRRERRAIARAAAKDSKRPFSECFQPVLSGGMGSPRKASLKLRKLAQTPGAFGKPRFTCSFRLEDEATIKASMEHNGTPHPMSVFRFREVVPLTRRVLAPWHGTKIGVVQKMVLEDRRTKAKLDTLLVAA